MIVLFAILQVGWDRMPSKPSVVPVRTMSCAVFGPVLVAVNRSHMSSPLKTDVRELLTVATTSA